MENELKKLMIAHGLTMLQERGELGDFIEFAIDEEPLEFSWFRVFSTIEKVCPFKVKAFKKDKTILIENEKLSDEQCKEYSESWTAPINLKALNTALEPVGVRLEFLEALNLPFDAEGHENFVRFEVKPL